MIDFNFVSHVKTTAEQINKNFLEASQSYLKNVIDCSDKPLVSIDFTHNPNSAINDLTQTKVTEGTLCRVVAWHDNEWGYANRICDVIDYIYLNNLFFSKEDSPMSKLMLSVMGAFAEFERALIKERQREGIALAKQRGVYKGKKKAFDKEKLQFLKERLD